jgi:hypothetical protein
MAALIDLSWHRDAAGYELLAEVEGEGATLLSASTAKPERIVPRGGKIIRYEPMKLEALCLMFASVRTPDDLLEFIEKYGPLTERGLDSKRGEDVEAALNDAAAFRSWLEGGETEARLAVWAGSEGKRVGRVEIYIVQDPGSGTAKIQYRARTLRAALWLQLLQKLTHGRPFHDCRHCGKWFETGPGTGRRADAKFCCEEHQVWFNRRKQSSKGSAAHA